MHNSILVPLSDSSYKVEVKDLQTEFGAQEWIEDDIEFVLHSKTGKQ